MKRTLMLMLVLALIAPALVASAKDVTYSDILADPPRYVGRTVTMKGLFLYSDPMKESFTIDQGGTSLEIFYRDLPSRDKDMILSHGKYSKARVTVAGVIRRFENNPNAYYMNATSLETAAPPAAAASPRSYTAYADILSDPSRYVGRTVIMKGAFAYSDAMRESFTFDQNGSLVEVFFRDLPQGSKDAILSQKKYSKRTVIATGVIQKFANSANSYFMNAASISFEKE